MPLISLLTSHMCVPDELGNGGYKIIPSLDSSIGSVNSVIRHYPKTQHNRKASNAETLQS